MIINKRNFIYLIGFICFLFGACLFVCLLATDHLYWWMFYFVEDFVCLYMNFMFIWLELTQDFLFLLLAGLDPVLHVYLYDDLYLVPWGIVHPDHIQELSLLLIAVNLIKIIFYLLYKHVFCMIYGCKKTSQWSYLCNVLPRNFWVSWQFWVFSKLKVGSHHHLIILLLWLQVNHFPCLWWILGVYCFFLFYCFFLVS